jgi:hypothetical protein
MTLTTGDLTETYEIIDVLYAYDSCSEEELIGNQQHSKTAWKPSTYSKRTPKPAHPKALQSLHWRRVRQVRRVLVNFLFPWGSAPSLAENYAKYLLAKFSRIL